MKWHKREPLPPAQAAATGAGAWVRRAWNALPSAPQTIFQTPVTRRERDAVAPDYARPNRVKPLGRREPVVPPPLNLSPWSKLKHLGATWGHRVPLALMTRQAAPEVKQAAAAIAGRQPLDELQLLALRAQLDSAFPALSGTPHGHAGVELAAVALAVRGIAVQHAPAELASGIAQIDFGRLRRGLPQDTSAPPLVQRCIELLLTLARSGAPGAEVAAALAAAAHGGPFPDAKSLALMAGSGQQLLDTLSALASAAGEDFDEARLQRLGAEVQRVFPSLCSTRWGEAAPGLVAAALLAAGLDPNTAIDDLAGAIAGLDLLRMRQGLPQAADAAPQAASAVRLLMALARAGRAGADIAASLFDARHAAGALDADTLTALAAEPVDLERRPAELAPVQQALQTRLAAAALPAERRLTPAQQQIAALAILQACGFDPALGQQVAHRIVGFDWRGALTGRGEATPLEVAVQKSLRHMALAGGDALLAARQLASPADGLLPVADLRIACLAARTLDPDGTRSLQQLLEDARRAHDTVALSAAALSGGAELPDARPRSEADPDVDLEAGRGALDELHGQWPTLQALRRRGVPAADADRRLPVFALVAMSRKLNGETPTAAQQLAAGAVRNGIVSEHGPLAFAEQQSQHLRRWLRPGAGAGWIHRWLFGNRLVTDPIQPLVDNGPLGSLNNIAAPQLAMKETLKPLHQLLQRLAVPLDGEEPAAEQLQADFAHLALLQHWRGKTQGMLGTEVQLRAEELDSIGRGAAVLAGRSGDDAASFADAVRAQLKDVQLDQDTLRRLYDDVARRTVRRGLAAASDAELEAIVQDLLAMDDAALRATQSPQDYDRYYREHPELQDPDHPLPAFGRGAMERSRANADRRDRDRAATLAEMLRQTGTSSGWNASSYRGGAAPDVLTLVTTALRAANVPGFGGRVGVNLVGPYQYSRYGEAIVRLGVNATGIEFNFGEGTTRNGAWTLGAGPGIGLFKVLGRWQRLNLIPEGGFGGWKGGGTDAVYRSVFLRVPRTSEDEGGVPGAGAGSSSDSLRTAYLADAIEELGRLLESGQPHALLRLLVKFPALSIGIADGDHDYNDTTRRERLGRFSASQGLVPGWRFPLSIGGSLGGSYIPERKLRIDTQGSTRAQRRQDFTQRKFQLGGGLQYAGRALPLSLGASMLPHKLNFPTSWSFLKTLVDGVVHRGGTYWSFETESLAAMLLHFREHGLSYARGMLEFRPDLQAVREQKLQQFAAEGRDAQEVERMRQKLYDDDVRAQLEVLHGVIVDREFVPGLSYRGTGEVGEAAHHKANELQAVRELALLSERTAGLARAKQREELHLLSQPWTSYVPNDIGFRMNTYAKDEAGLGSYLVGGKKMDARTNNYRAKV